MENGEYLLAAFAIVWAILFGYVFFLLNRQKGLQKEVESLKTLLKEKDTEG